MDFWRFSCGNWNKLNPIPPDQARWSVYGKLAQENLQYLWGVLEAGGEGLAGAYGERTKDRRFLWRVHGRTGRGAGRNRAAQAHLDAIAGLNTLKDLPPVLARMHLGSARSNAIFGFGASQDFANSEQEIAFASAGGLGLPDRDYYTKTDAKSEETRAKYLEHVARMFELLGDAPAAAKAQAQTVMEIETALAKASLTQVELRDPYKQFHKMPRAKLDGDDAFVRLGGLLEGQRTHGHGHGQRD